MRVRTNTGYTDCEFEDFASAEPKLYEIREQFRAGKLDKDAVYQQVRQLFGNERMHKEWRTVVGNLQNTPAIKAWHKWSEEGNHIKLLYSPEVVSGTITQEGGNV